MTGYAEKAAEEAPDIEAVIAGFNVAVPNSRRRIVANRYAGEALTKQVVRVSGALGCSP